MDITSKEPRADKPFLTFPQSYHWKKDLGYSLKSPDTASWVPRMTLSKKSFMKAAKVIQWQDHRLKCNISPHSVFMPHANRPAAWRPHTLPMRMAASFSRLYQRCHDLKRLFTSETCIHLPVNFTYFPSSKPPEWMWSLTTWLHKYLKSWLFWCVYLLGRHLVCLVWTLLPCLLLPGTKVIFVGFVIGCHSEMFQLPIACNKPPPNLAA